MTSPIFFLLTLIATLLAWLVWSYGLRPYYLDEFREEIFDIRSSLFQLGAEGSIGFNTPLYRELETLYCGLIRFGHRISFVSYMVGMVLKRIGVAPDNSEFGNRIGKLVDALDPATQAKVVEGLDRMNRAIKRLIAHSSVSFRVAVRILSIARALGVANRPQPIIDVMKAEAYRAEVRLTRSRVSLAKV